MIIYKTTNKINGKIYVGKDSNENPRYLGSGLLVARAIKKYGKENFVKETMEQCESLEKLSEREIYWIKKLNATNKSTGYNIANGGAGGNVYTEYNQDSKKRMIEKLKGKKRPQYVLDKMKEDRIKYPEKYVFTELHKKKIGDAHKGKIIKEGQILKLKERMKNFNNYSDEFLLQQSKDKHGKNGPMFGKTHSEETKRKMSESHKKLPPRVWDGIPKSESTRKKVSDSLRNRSSTDKLKSYIKRFTTINGYPPSTELQTQKLRIYISKEK